MNNSLKKYFPIFVLPTLLAFILAFVLPFLMGVGLSFTEFTTVENASFNGVQNYIRAFTTDTDFLRTSSGAYTYNGTEQTPTIASVTVKNGVTERTISDPTAVQNIVNVCTLEVENATNAGQATVTLKLMAGISTRMLLNVKVVTK